MAADKSTTNEIAKLFGVSANTVRDLVNRGVIDKLKVGQFDTFDTVQRYCAHLRETAAGRGGEDAVLNLTEERAKLAQEQRIGQRIKNEAARGDLIERDRVLAGWADILSRVRSRLMAVPSRVRTRRAHLLSDDIEAVESEIREALEELSSEA